jgi:hypothetical protein
MLTGSVRHGYERPESDLDFFLFGPSDLERALVEFRAVSEKNESKVLEAIIEDVVVHLAFWSSEGAERILLRRPYMLYPVLDSEIVHDPRHIAQRFVERVDQYFAARTKLKDAWSPQMAEHRRFKTGEISRLEFPQWSDFLTHLEQTHLV